MVRHSEIGILSAALRRSQSLSAESEVLGHSFRVRRAAPSLLMQSEETVVASHGAATAAILTMLVCSSRESDDASASAKV